MKKTLWLSLSILLLLLGGFLKFKKVTHQLKILKVAIPGPWNTIHPGLQHTLWGDIILSNQFEALVGTNDNGVSIPLAAKSWKISDDFKVFQFQIDQSRVFSDGSKLTAQDFKRSWEDAAKLDPMSSNNSLLDVLYKLEGYDQFKKSGSISGIIAVNDGILELRFSSPFRRALEHLQGNRFAAYKEKEGTFIGTGFFLIENVGPNHVVMKPRPDNHCQSECPTLHVSHITSDKIISSLKNGEVDAIHYFSGHAPDTIELENDNIKSIVAQNSLHLAIGLNSNSTSIFSQATLRLALFYLVKQALDKNRKTLPSLPYFELDHQYFMNFQAGRLEASEEEKIVLQGKLYVKELIETSQRRPIIAHSGISTRKVIDLLKQTGLTFDDKTGYLPPKELLALAYSENGPDLLIDVFSIASGDPDGIYHILGKNGAIRTPYVYSEKVEQLLEEGRNLIDVTTLDEHYKKVSRALLTEVPMIHLGFARALTAYRKDRVEIDTTVLRRNQGQLHFLRAK